MKYEITLTGQEAKMLALLAASSWGSSPVKEAIASIVKRLVKINPKIEDLQFDAWKNMGAPEFDL